MIIRLILTRDRKVGLWLNTPRRFLVFVGLDRNLFCFSPSPMNKKTEKRHPSSTVCYLYLYIEYVRFVFIHFFVIYDVEGLNKTFS